MPRKKGHKPIHSKREHHIYNMFRRKYPNWTVGHAWAVTMGFSPKMLHKAKFKTTPRQYSITHKRAAIARKLKRGGASASTITSKMRSMDSRRRANRKMRTHRGSVGARRRKRR